MIGIKEGIRLAHISWVLLRHGLDEIVLSAHLLRPLRFLKYFSPFFWFRSEESDTGHRVALRPDALSLSLLQAGAPTGIELALPGRTLDEAYTVTAWVNRSGLTSADRVVISSAWDSSTGWMLGFRDGGIIFDFGNNRKSTGPATVLTDTNYLIAVRFDDTKSVFGGGINDYSISFWDGAAWTHSDGSVNRGIRLQGLEIGAFNTGTRQIEGFLDDIRIYDETLAQADLNALAADQPDRELVLKVTHDRSADALIFTWNGRLGMTYDLLANPDLSTGPSNWGAILSGVTSPQSIARPTDERTFYAVEEAP